MRRLGELYNVGDVITVIGEWNGFPSCSNTPRLLVNRIYKFNNQVYVGRRYITGEYITDHLYLEESAFKPFIDNKDIPTHYKSKIIITGTVEKYNRYDYTMDTYRPDYSLKDIRVNFWIGKRKPNIYLYQNTIERGIELLYTSKNGNYQECCDIAMEYLIK